MTSFADHLRTSPPSLWALDGDLPPEALVTSCRSAGFDVRTVALNGVTDKAGLLAAFAEGLRFPDWFGRNFDALADCLGDLSWLPPGPRVVVLLGSANASRVARGDWRTALDIVEEAATASAADNRDPLHFVTLP